MQASDVKLTDVKLSKKKLTHSVSPFKNDVEDNDKNKENDPELSNKPISFQTSAVSPIVFTPEEDPIPPKQLHGNVETPKQFLFRPPLCTSTPRISRTILMSDKKQKQNRQPLKTSVLLTEDAHGVKEQNVVAKTTNCVENTCIKLQMSANVEKLKERSSVEYVQKEAETVTNSLTKISQETVKKSAATMPKELNKKTKLSKEVLELMEQNLKMSSSSDIESTHLCNGRSLRSRSSRSSDSNPNSKKLGNTKTTKKKKTAKQLDKLKYGLKSTQLNNRDLQIIRSSSDSEPAFNKSTAQKKFVHSKLPSKLTSDAVVVEGSSDSDPPVYSKSVSKTSFRSKKANIEKRQNIKTTRPSTIKASLIMSPESGPSSDTRNRRRESRDSQSICTILGSSPSNNSSSTKTQKSNKTFTDLFSYNTINNTQKDKAVSDLKGKKYALKTQKEQLDQTQKEQLDQTSAVGSSSDCVEIMMDNTNRDVHVDDIHSDYSNISQTVTKSQPDKNRSRPTSKYNNIVSASPSRSIDLNTSNASQKRKSFIGSLKHLALKKPDFSPNASKRKRKANNNNSVINTPSGRSKQSSTISRALSYNDTEPSTSKSGKNKKLEEAKLMSLWCEEGETRTVTDITDIDVILNNIPDTDVNTSEGVQCRKATEKFISMVKSELKNTVLKIKSVKKAENRFKKAQIRTRALKRDLQNAEIENISLQAELDGLQKERLTNVISSWTEHFQVLKQKWPSSKRTKTKKDCVYIGDLPEEITQNNTND
ncbi:uncharacterized protein LOC126809797 isoform X2 [Patella vulgata]|nr:uncharacterized protein LOC126809797 isoform X2 [Patella vulgata]